MARITQETKEETRSLIIDEATRLFKENGYDNTNTRTIAQNCRIAEGTLFNYFATKEEILLEVFDTLAKKSDVLDQTPSKNPLDEIIDILINPMNKIGILPKKFIFDTIVAAVKLSRKKNSLLYRLYALDMAYVKQVEEKMQRLLQFPPEGMTAQLLSEIMYSTTATNYVFYILDETMDFNRFQTELRTKLTSLMQPYRIA